MAKNYYTTTNVEFADGIKFNSVADMPGMCWVFSPRIMQPILFIREGETETFILPYGQEGIHDASGFDESFFPMTQVYPSKIDFKGDDRTVTKTEQSQ